MLKYENPGGPRRRPPQHEQRQVAVLQVRVLVLPHSKNPFESISLVHIYGKISSDLYRFVQCDIKKCAFDSLKLEQNPQNCD